MNTARTGCDNPSVTESVAEFLQTVQVLTIKLLEFGMPSILRRGSLCEWV